jgi:hypothetical protein
MPSIVPLDFTSLLRSREDTHAQLAKTVEDLATCLQIVERGLDTILSVNFRGIIEEDYEESDYSPQHEASLR